jgi:hypothetical protein
MYSSETHVYGAHGARLGNWAVETVGKPAHHKNVMVRDTARIPASEPPPSHCFHFFKDAKFVDGFTGDLGTDRQISTYVC